MITKLEKKLAKEIDDSFNCLSRKIEKVNSDLSADIKYIRENDISSFDDHIRQTRIVAKAW